MGHENTAHRIDYNRDLNALTKLLEGIEQSGEFYTAGIVEAPFPHLEVEGVGMISFPVPQGQVRKITSRAERAPYGKGGADDRFQAEGLCSRERFVAGSFILSAEEAETRV